MATIIRCRRLWFRSLLAPSGVTPRQYSVLARISELGAPTLNDMGRRLFADVTVLSRMVTRLEKAGMVTRVQSPSDRRAWNVRLTRRGEALVERIHPRLEAAEREMLSGLTDDEVRELRRRLGAILTNISGDMTPEFADELDNNDDPGESDTEDS